MATNVDISNFIKSLEEDYLPRARAAVIRAVETFAEFIMGEAQELCPKKTGALASSGVVGEAQGALESIFIEMGFNTNYAAAVHEIATNKHPNGQWKYLETPMKEHAPKLLDFVLAELEKEFGS